MHTEILVILDRSGSMNTIASDVIGGYNQFIQEQREVPGAAKVTFVQFNDVCAPLYIGKPLAEVPLLDSKGYVPSSGTALYDAIGSTLTEQAQRIEREGWADMVVVCIITDGQENCSREYTQKKVSSLTKKVEAKGWHFVYLGANQNSSAVARDMGITSDLTRDFTPDLKGVLFAYAHTSSTVQNLRALISAKFKN